MGETRNFTEGRIFAPLIRFALPVLPALFLRTMYGEVDLGVVGRFGGNLSDVYVSAVSTGSQIMRSVTIVITGLAMGLTVTVGRKTGAGRKREAGRIIGGGIWLFGVIAVILTVVMVFSAPCPPLWRRTSARGSRSGREERCSAASPPLWRGPHNRIFHVLPRKFAASSTTTAIVRDFEVCFIYPVD